MWANVRAVDNSLSVPPEYYDRKIKTQITWRFWIAAFEAPYNAIEEASMMEDIYGEP